MENLGKKKGKDVNEANFQMPSQTAQLNTEASSQIGMGRDGLITGLQRLPGPIMERLIQDVHSLLVARSILESKRTGGAFPFRIVEQILLL